MCSVLNYYVPGTMLAPQQHPHSHSLSQYRGDAQEVFLRKTYPFHTDYIFLVYFLYPLSKYKLREIRDLFCLFTALFPEPVTVPGTQ